MSDEELIKLAKEYREHAYVPYSKFKVGAAVLGASGKAYGGCNIENASYPVTNCAERTRWPSSGLRPAWSPSPWWPIRTALVRHVARVGRSWPSSRYPRL